MFKRTTIVLIAIFLLSLLIRVYKLSEFPPSLNWDEVSHGYNAFSILKTGSDEWGKFLPLDNFRAYGDYPLPVSLYLIIPSIVGFGLNEFSLRFPTALLGSLVVIPQYFLTYFVTRNRKAALISALLIGIIPWTILPSRAVFQSTIALLFIVSSLALLFGSKFKSYLLPLSLICLGLSAYSYHNSRIVAVLLLPCFLLYYVKVLIKKIYISKFISRISIFIVTLFFTPLLFVLLSPGGHARANWVFLIDQGAVSQIEQERANSPLPAALKRIIYNRATYFVLTGGKNYVEYFIPEFLFAKGGTQYQFSLPGRGLLYWTLLPFVYGGLVWAAWNAIKKRNPQARMLLFLLAAAPIPAAVTIGQFHVLRSNLLIPGLLTTTSIVLVKFLGQIRRTKIFYWLTVFAIFLPITIFLVTYLRELFTDYSTKYSWSWQYGYKQVVETLQKDYSQYDRFIITKKYGEPHEFVLFFWPWDPSTYKNDPSLVRYFRSDWYWVDHFDKFFFVNDWEIKNMEKNLVVPGKTLLFTSPGNFTGGQKVETINFLDGQPAFDIVKL